MSDAYEITDDDDSISLLQRSGLQKLAVSGEPIELSSDEDAGDNSAASVPNLTSDEEDNLPQTRLKSMKQRQDVIKQLFPAAQSARPTPQVPKVPGIDKMIGGVMVNMPVEPYGCQIALMSKVITAIKTGKNCLLESPTGSGKTLALLCSALAWQSCERARIGQLLAEQKAEEVTELKHLDGAVEYVGSAPSVNFSKSVFGERSIYDSPVKNDGSGSKTKRFQDHEDTNEIGLVKLNEKRRRLNSPGTSTGEDSKASSPGKMTTPQKPIGSPKAETPENVSTPTVYYGSRTHKQLQQVIKEFKRISYCGEAKMTVLASRDYSCIREFDRSVWSSKNDMCRGCTKSADRRNGDSNCKFYDNRTSLHHDSLPPAFDLDELVEAGKQKGACPYYAARAMANSAHIVFCPYNYLIEPSIRDNMKIELKDNVVIIDEAHNIEDICRDSASTTITKDQIQNAISELEKVSGYLFSGQEVAAQVDHILKKLKTWNEWFINQVPLVANKPVNNGEAVHTWHAADFVTTLDNHNLGKSHSYEFKQNASAFCQRLRENPKALFGVTQSTATLVESIDTALTYLFRCDGQFMDDFKPALVRTVVAEGGEANAWRRSQYNQRIQKESLELRLMCMNPAIVFEALKQAKCVILASGTLTPLGSLHSELGTEFPLKVAPNHVIPGDRIWVGTLSTCPDGSRLECKSTATSQPHVQDAIGAVLLWACRVTPRGVLCFMPSYQLMNRLANRWRETGVWRQLEQLKTVFMESRNVRDHNDIMEDYYREVDSGQGAVLFAVFRGKVSEGLDFRDHQARAVITIGIPYPNTYDMAVKEKMNYNNKYEKQRNLLNSSEWLRVQAYRALNQAVGRCVRHRADWGAVLMVDARFTNPYYTEHLSKWVRNFLNNNHHTFESLVNSTDSMESFMKHMTIRDTEDDN